MLTDLIKRLVLQILRPGTQESVYIVELTAQPWLSVAAKKQQQPVPAQPQGPGDPLRQEAPPPASETQPGAAPETTHDHRCAPFVIFTGLVSHTQLAAVLQPQQARPQSAPPPQIVRMRGPGEQMKFFQNLFRLLSSECVCRWGGCLCMLWVADLAHAVLRAGVMRRKLSRMRARSPTSGQGAWASPH